MIQNVYCLLFRLSIQKTVKQTNFVVKKLRNSIKKIKNFIMMKTVVYSTYKKSQTHMLLH